MTVEDVKQKIEELEKTQKRRLINYLRNYAFTPDLAEDSLQDAYVEAILCAEKIDNPSKFSSWILTVAIRKAQRSRTEAERQLRMSYYKWQTESINNLGDYEKTHFAICVQDVLSTFPAYYSMIMELYYSKGYTLRDIAQMLNVKATTVRQAHVRIIRAIREALNRE